MYTLLMFSTSCKCFQTRKFHSPQTMPQADFQKDRLLDHHRIVGDIEQMQLPFPLLNLTKCTRRVEQS